MSLPGAKGDNRGGTPKGPRTQIVGFRAHIPLALKPYHLRPWTLKELQCGPFVNLILGLPRCLRHSVSRISF